MAKYQSKHLPVVREGADAVGNVLKMCYFDENDIR